MNTMMYNRSNGLVDRYLRLNNEVTAHGYRTQDVQELSNLCYDAVKIISELRCNYSQKMARRRMARHERLRKDLFNTK